MTGCQFLNEQVLCFVRHVRDSVFVVFLYFLYSILKLLSTGVLWKGTGLYYSRPTRIVQSDAYRTSVQSPIPGRRKVVVSPNYLSVGHFVSYTAHETYVHSISFKSFQNQTCKSLNAVAAAKRIAHFWSPLDSHTLNNLQLRIESGISVFAPTRRLYAAVTRALGQDSGRTITNATVTVFALFV